MRAKFAIGDRVIYTRDKYSNRPGPRAKNVSPTPHGETYTYQVDKYWVVSEFLADGSIVLQTRRGKNHVVTAGDPRLRKARWWGETFLRQSLSFSQWIDTRQWIGTGQSPGSAGTIGLAVPSQHGLPSWDRTTQQSGKLCPARVAPPFRFGPYNLGNLEQFRELSAATANPNLLGLNTVVLGAARDLAVRDWAICKL